MSSNGHGHDRVVVVDGCRTPFLRSGTDFVDLTSYDLARLAIAGLLERTRIDPSIIDQVVMGCVVQEMNTSNVAREAALSAGIPKEVPAHTVTMACISSSRAVTTGVESILAGASDIVVAGGTETLSDVPIRFRKRFRRKLMATQKYKGPADWLGFFRGFRFGDLLPEVPSISEFSTGLTMGQSGDRLSAKFGVTRRDQDQYAARSHQLAAQATENGRLGQEVLTVVPPPKFGAVTRDNGFRGDTTVEKLAKLRPSFTPKFGTATAGNSSFLTDGASALLLMRESKARELGFTPRAAIRGYAYAGSDTLDELLLGPAFASPKALEAAGLQLQDVGVLEIHEAFAGALLAVVRALESSEFGEQRLGRSGAVGPVSMDRVNLQGGSLSIGHPFGATGARLVMSAVRRLADEDQQFALLTACAAGGLGHAMVLERV